ncbi:hypothetical protein GDO78_014421 [Eleutherodactylus coqui]|uniref:Uncharacterized protein n=1 Tax=Eleutherodactylus coqui TaxID=57060 RepID=A0A8J6EEJ7_ELECQ|nr:hypothetical protein GDO78_014421 [Eleutherodactylus coqui]
MTCRIEFTQLQHKISKDFRMFYYFFHNINNFLQKDTFLCQHIPGPEHFYFSFKILYSRVIHIKYNFFEYSKVNFPSQGVQHIIQH